MATHYSTSRRAKGSNAKIVVPSWDDVWASFNAENPRTTIEAMNVEGWKTLEQASEAIGLSKVHVNHMANDGKMEIIKKRVYHGGATREMAFVRPKI